ncbi:MAG: hypothetical protein JWN34_4016 [Bryobacterales bacterium]|nr:hypothetical protein [Bryobacterales bacterium]
MAAAVGGGTCYRPMELTGPGSEPGPGLAIHAAVTFRV